MEMQGATNLVSCCPKSLAVLYISRSDAALLLSHQRALRPSAGSGFNQLNLTGCVVVVDTGQGLRARQITAVNAQTEEFTLCNDSVAKLDDLSDAPVFSLRCFSPQQLHALCCELSWCMVQGISPRLEAQKVGCVGR